MKWDRESKLYNELGLEGPPRIFPSLCDWLDDEVPIEWLADFLKLIHDTPKLDWLLLTKRPENFESQLLATYEDWNLDDKHTPQFTLVEEWLDGTCPRNVWIGVSVEDRPRKNRIDELRKIPAVVRFLSLEPLLEDLGELDLTGIKWAIAGGESGPQSRPCNVEWMRDLVRQCKSAGVPCFVKQLGAFVNSNNGYTSGPIRQWFKHPKGGDMKEFPEDLRVREFPDGPTPCDKLSGMPA